MLRGTQQLQDFFTWANTVHNILKFTQEKKETTTSFLDTRIYIDDGDKTLQTKA